MRKKDIKFFIKFNSHIGMYICPQNESNIVAFITGYECCSENKCKFTEIIKDRLQKKYKINHNSLGWPDQIERFSEKKGIDWVDAYFMISYEILNNESN